MLSADAPAAATDWLVGLSEYVHGVGVGVDVAASCVTVSCALPPEPVTVTCPVRAVVVVLAATEYVIVPFVLPDAPAVIVSHD